MARPHATPDVFRAVAHPVRRDILARLRSGERTVGEIAAQYSMSFAAISKHLQILRLADLVRFRQRGREICYRLHRRPLTRVMTLGERLQMTS